MAEEVVKVRDSTHSSLIAGLVGRIIKLAEESGFHGENDPDLSLNPIPGKRIVNVYERNRPYGTQLTQFNTIVGREDGSIDVYCSFVCAAQSNSDFFKCPAHHLPRYKQRRALLYRFQHKVQQMVDGLSQFYPRVRYISVDNEFKKRVALYSRNS